MKKYLVAAACGCLSIGAFAENTNETATAQSDRIVVTATRRPSPMRTIAGNPSVITAEDIAQGHYTSVPEALQKKAGVFFRNYSDNPSQATVDLRGFGGDNPHGKTLVLLNGRKLNRPDMAAINWALIPMQAVERIEVVRGANSVLYGDHAVSGVINIITKEASETPQTSLFASVGSDQAYEQNLVTSGSLEGVGYTATLGHQSGDGYRDRSRYDILSGSLRLEGQISDRVSAYTEAAVVKEQHQLPGALSSGQDRKDAANPNDAAREEYYSLNTGIEALLTDELIVNLDAGISHKDLEADLDSWFSYYDYLIDSYTLSPKFTLLSPIGSLENELIFGADLARETLNTKKFDSKERTNRLSDTQVTKQTVGGYLADTLSLTDTLLLSGGYRLEANKVHAEHKGSTPYDESETHREEAWQAALTWLPTDSLKVFAGIDRTYRYPFVDEQAIYTGWQDAFNKDLKPETGISYEAGIEFMPATNLVLQATVFRTDMEDEIAWGFTNNINLDETTHRGVELAATYRTEHFELDAYYTWLQSEFTDGINSGNELPWVPQNKLDVNLALFLTESLTFSTHMSYIGSMRPLGDNSNTSAAKESEFAVFDFLLEYTRPVGSCELTLFGAVDNAFETEYNLLGTDYGFGVGYYPAPERTWKAGLGLRF